MQKSTQLKQQALMLKAAFEEGWHERERLSSTTYLDGSLQRCWNNSTAKQLHDQLLMEAKGNTNVRA
tara:strand:+ start:6970 stop:7170 length:201 start_codon:yes stop_codon:yes gene_type:complete